MKATILVVEDSAAFSKMLCSEIRKRGFEARAAYSRTEARALLEKGERFFAAMLDLGLPDAPDGEVVDEVLAYDIPSIVLTGMFDPSTRALMDSKPIVDFVLKQGFEDIYYAMRILDRIYKNREVTALVVDDSRTTRALLVSHLSTQLLNVIEATNGREALQMLEKHPEISLVVTDYNMPDMDGFELTRQLRKQKSKEELAIMAVSSSDHPDISSRFLKYGANDFLSKPFTKEELISRVHLNIGMLEAIAAQRAAAKELEAINAALVAEQQEARTRQIGMVTNDFENDPDFLVQTFYKASDILSGDAYSLHKTPQGGALIYLIDGMGHGLIPSFTAFAVASAIKQGVAQKDGFSQLLGRVSQTLRGTLSEDEQLSFSFFHLPPEYDRLEYAIGGMYPAHVRFGESTVALKANNPPFMAFMPDIQPSQLPAPGFEKLLVYTDGLVEDTRLAMAHEDVSILLEGDTFVWVCEKLQEDTVEDDTTVIYFEKRP
ncbi:MAG: response regulator [Campylobacterales bacterium]